MFTLLDPLPLEMGVERLASGQLHVAVRTYLMGCTGAMFQWWFGSGPTGGLPLCLRNLAITTGCMT